MNRHVVRMLSMVALAILLAPGVSSAQRASILTGSHNLSASGPGTIRAATEQEVCIFCHTPHNASEIQPLWNRGAPVSAYRVYSSSSLRAAPGQPTGSSKLCLSCHDGTIALGSVVSRDQPIGMVGGMTTLPPGASNLGTDLSDDHPISFRYDATLAGQARDIKDPSSLPPAVKLDANRELQCTSCHDAHDDSRGKFLVMDNADSQLCESCHQKGQTDVSGHRQCESCHQPHSAPSGPYLLKKQTVGQSCLSCHDGGVGQNGPNIAADLDKFSRHDTNSPVDQPDHIPNEATCNDCHEPHTMRAMATPAPGVPGNFGRIDGVTAAGVATPTARFGYEVCFKCHGDRAATAPRVSRRITQSNTRLQFSPTAVSFHPVEAAGRNSDVPSLRPGYTTASVIGCDDCHNSDTGAKAGGAGPNGVHGSREPGLLVARYETTDHTSESAAAYALCYRCHERSSILADQSFRRHRKHVSGEQAPCSTCHDGHGISSAQGTVVNNAHLINFDTSIVGPDPVTRRLEYISKGPRAGTCYLTCHGKRHSPLSY